MQTATESSANSQGVLSVLMPFLEWTTLSEDIWHIVIRKAAHMAEFALLGLLWSNALWDLKSGGKSAVLTQACCVLFLCLVAALTDETIQLFVAGRSGELRDVWIDLFGSLIGTAIGIVDFS